MGGYYQSDRDNICTYTENCVGTKNVTMVMEDVNGLDGNTSFDYNYKTFDVCISIFWLKK